MSSVTTKNPSSKRRAKSEAFAIKSGTDLMKWRQERGISRKLFAQMADCSERTLATYEKSPVFSGKIERPVIETIRLIRALQELAGDETALKSWLHTPNSAFGKRTPLAVIKEGEADLLWQMVYQLRQGSFA